MYVNSQRTMTPWEVEEDVSEVDDKYWRSVKRSLSFSFFNVGKVVPRTLTTLTTLMSMNEN